MQEFARRPVIFCATQRSGSSMIFDDFLLLRGLVSRESERMARLASGADRDVGNLAELVTSIEAREGFFSDKVMYHSIVPIGQWIRPQSDPHDAERVFYESFAGARWIYIERKDVFLQSVSMLMAEKTGVWSDFQFENLQHKPELARSYNADVPYRVELLRNYYHGFVLEKCRWMLFFERFKINPEYLYYEDANNLFPHYLVSLLNECGAFPDLDGVNRRHLKIGNDRNAAFAQRMREDYAADVLAGRWDLWQRYSSV